MGSVTVSEIARRHAMIKENFDNPASAGDIYRLEFGQPEDIGRLVTVVEIGAYRGSGVMQWVTLLDEDGGLTQMLLPTFYGLFERATGPGGDHGERVGEEHAQRPAEEHADHVAGEPPDDG